jgi:uncharacterized protein (DUF433 family)
MRHKKAFLIGLLLLLNSRSFVKRETMNFEYIASDKEILGGRPIIFGTRLSVDFILQLIASGATIDDIIGKYPQLKKEAVIEAILYAAKVVSNEIIITLKSVA